MDRKSEQKLEQWGAAKILTDLVNVTRFDPENLDEADIRKAMKDLWKTMNTAGARAKADASQAAGKAGADWLAKRAVDNTKKFMERYDEPLRKGADNPAMVWWFAAEFQRAWERSRDAEAITGLVDAIFAPFRASAFYGESLHGAISASSVSKHGKFAVEPRDLLDAIGMEFLRNRKKLHRCERLECGRYFIKNHSRDKTCSKVCSEEMQCQRQTEWARKHRQEQRPA